MSTAADRSKRASSHTKHETRIVVDGVELTVTQTGNSVTVRRVVARDRKRKLDITSAITTSLDEPAAITVVKTLKDVVAHPTAHCTCDYRYGYSDHAEHCESIYVAKYDGGGFDDD